MRMARIMFGLDRQKQFKVADRPRHRSVRGQLRQEHIPRPTVRHKAIAGAKSEDVVPPCRIAQRSHHVGPVGKRHHAAGQGRTGAPAGSARGTRGVIGIARHAIDGVIAVRAKAEFRRIGLADDHRPCPAQPRHHRAVGGRNMVAEGGRAIGGDDPRRFGQILDRHGQTLQRTRRRPLGLGQQRVAVAQRHDGVDRRIGLVDPVQRFPHQFSGGDGSGTQGRQLVGRVMINHAAIHARR